jgi:hypothetical protein
MKIIVQPRRAGKTYKLVEWVRQGKKSSDYPYWSRIMLVSNMMEAERIRNSYDLDCHQVFTFDGWQHRYFLPTTEVEVAIDNAELIFTRMFNSDIRMISMTGEEND